MGLFNADTDKAVSRGIFSGTTSNINLIQDVVIDSTNPDSTKNYKLRVWIHDTGIPQNNMQGKEMVGKVVVNSSTIQYTDEDCFYVENGSILTYGYDYDKEQYTDTCPKDVVIPKTINGVTVTTIEAALTPEYGGHEINNVIIPDTVTTIGEEAFSSSNLTSITIPDSVTTIDTSAFYNNKLTNVFLPDSVTSINISAFKTNQLTNVVIPNGVINIDDHSFDDNKLTNIVIPNTVTTIGANAISNNQLTSITIPSSVTTIREYALDYNNLSAITIIGKNSEADFPPNGLEEYWNGECTNIIYQP